MEHLIYLTIIAGIIWFFLSAFIYDAVDAKRKTIELCPEAALVINNMYREARWHIRNIGACDTYADICKMEDELVKYAQCYKGTEGFDSVFRDLLELLEQARRVVRMGDKMKLKVQDVRYGEE